MKKAKQQVPFPLESGWRAQLPTSSQTYYKVTFIYLITHTILSLCTWDKGPSSSPNILLHYLYTEHLTPRPRPPSSLIIFSRCHRSEAVWVLPQRRHVVRQRDQRDAVQQQHHGARLADQRDHQLHAPGAWCEVRNVNRGILSDKCKISTIATNFQPKRSSGHQDSQRAAAGHLPPHQRDQGARHPLQGRVQPAGGQRTDQAGSGREGGHCGWDWGPWSVYPQDKTFWAKVATPTYIWERAHEDWNSPIEANYKPISPG